MTAKTTTPDTVRIVRWLRAHPGSSVMEVRFALFISNVTARMSECREQGIEFRKWRDDQGIYRYSVVEPGQGTLGLEVAS